MKGSDMRVLLTGATGGIGSCAAGQLAREGASLLLTARDETRLGQLRERLHAPGQQIECVVADIASEKGRADIADAVRRFEGGINVLINNAAVNEFGAFERQANRDIATVMHTNAVAPMLLTHDLLPELHRHRGARIVNVGSIIGSIGLPGQVAYCSSKFALHGFSEALRRELRGSGIDIVYVAPRTTDTSLNDAGLQEQNRQLGVAVDDPAHVAKQVVDALLDGRRETFIGWPERLFVKINSLLPGIVDRSVTRQAALLFQERHAGAMPATPEGVKQ